MTMVCSTCKHCHIDFRNWPGPADCEARPGHRVMAEEWPCEKWEPKEQENGKAN